MLCFRLRRLISLSFIYYPGERGKEERKEGKQEGKREILVLNYSLQSLT